MRIGQTFRLRNHLGRLTAWKLRIIDFSGPENRPQVVVQKDNAAVEEIPSTTFRRWVSSGLLVEEAR